MIEHLDKIDTIRKYEERYKRETGKKPFDVSHWDPGNAYVERLYNVLRIPDYNFSCNYNYSYELSESTVKKTIEKIYGNSYNECYGVFFSNSTSAILNIASFIKNHNIQRVCILEPSYFSLPLVFYQFDIDFIKINLEFTDNQFIIPIEKILTSGCEAIWITSPVFSSGVYFNSEEITKLNYLIDKSIYIISDESVSILGNEIGKKLKPSLYHISLFSPHKTIVSNSLKFSIVICHKSFEKEFNNWTDILSGGLSLSNVVAINHFLNPNYFICLDVLKQHTTNARKELLKLFNNSEQGLLLSSQGQYCTLFYQNIPFNKSQTDNFIHNIIYNLGVSLVPGYLNGYDKDFGFCFRINLCLNPNELLLNLMTLDQYLGTY